MDNKSANEQLQTFAELKQAGPGECAEQHMLPPQKKESGTKTSSHQQLTLFGDERQGPLPLPAQLQLFHDWAISPSHAGKSVVDDRCEAVLAIAPNGSNQTSQVPSMQALEAAAIKQLTGMLKNDPGKKPSEEAVLTAAKMMAAKAHRELTAQQCQGQKPTEPQREGGLKVSPCSFNQRVTVDRQAKSLDGWG